MHHYPPEVVAILEGYENRISDLVAQLCAVRDFRYTRKGEVVPRDKQRQLLLLALRIRREAIGLARYLRKIEERDFAPSPLYWLERARSQLQVQQLQEGSAQSAENSHSSSQGEQLGDRGDEHQGEPAPDMSSGTA